LKSLYEAINLGGINIKNRFVRSATHEGLSVDGMVTEKLINLYENLAKNDVGLIISGGIEINEEIAFPNSLRLSRDSYIDPLKDLTKNVHENGSKIMAQLLYGGSFIFTQPTYTVKGPSAVEDRVTKITPKAMTIEEINNLVIDFSEAAYRCKAAGFDGVQIQASAGFMLNKFLSPFFNRRQDIYGGSIENRVRFLSEIREAIAKKCGKDYPVFIKVSIDDLMKSDVKGLAFDEGKEIVRHLAEKGYDAIEACGGMIGETPLTADYNNGQPYFKEAYNALSKEIQVSLIAIGGIRTEFDAHELINSDHVDAVAFSRPFIAEVDLVENMKNKGNSKCTTCFQCNGPEGIRCILNS